MRATTLLVILVIAPTISAGQTTLPAPVTAGFDYLRDGNCEAAFRVWTFAWTSPEDIAKRQQLIEGCGVLGRMGEYYGYDVIRVVPLGPNVLRIYTVLRYKSVPVYLLIVAYRPAGTWKITGLFWNTEADKLLPPGLLSRDTTRP